MPTHPLAGSGLPPGVSKMQRMLSYWAATATLYLFCVVLIYREVLAGAIPPKVGGTVIGFAVVALAAFLLLIRLSPRLGLHNWRLAMGQAVFAVVYDLVLYAVIHSVHTAMLIGMPVVVVFCAFALRPRQTYQLSAFALTGLGATTLMMTRLEPVAYPAATEFVNFILTAVGVIAVAVVTGDLHRLRARLSRQKSDLESALAKIEMLATTDELTHLANRRHMHQLLDQQERRHGEQAQRTCIALIDVDNFKLLNDRYGHAAGDAVLQAFARQTKAMLRHGDTIARWGGEEFLLLMPNTALDAATTVLERMLESVRSMSLAAVDPALRLTFSAGVVECGADEVFAEAIRRADGAMYRAKANGRNLIERG